MRISRQQVLARPLRQGDAIRAQPAREGADVDLGLVRASFVMVPTFTSSTRPTASAYYAGLLIVLRDGGQAGVLQYCRQTAGGTWEWQDAGTGSGSVSIYYARTVENETPAGTINGVNVTFTLADTPSPASSLALYLNGVRLIPTTHYTLAGATITMQAGMVPQTGDSLRADYRKGDGAGPLYVENETPSGTIDGSNPTFTLANSPTPASSLRLFLNGVRLIDGVHFVLVGSTITYQAGNIPQTGDSHRADYRY